MNGLKNLTDEELMKAVVPLLVHPSFAHLTELMRRRQAQQIKSVCSLSAPTDIYRAQGQVKAYDSMLNLEAEIKALK